MDWLEAEHNLVEVAEIVVLYPQGSSDKHQLLLGRDTSSSYYDFHARSGSLKQTKAPVVWSSPAQLQTVQFDAHEYRAEYELPGGMPEVVAISCTHEKAVLRLSGIVLLP